MPGEIFCVVVALAMFITTPMKEHPFQFTPSYRGVAGIANVSAKVVIHRRFSLREARGEKKTVGGF